MARFDNRREYKKDLYRRNQNIRVPEVRVINSDGCMVGILPVAQAIALAKEQELDLVEISPNAQPPVCKILDYNRYVYEQGKKAAEAKKKQAKVTLKELRIKSRIAAHDLDVKIRQIEEFCVRRYGAFCSGVPRARKPAQRHWHPDFERYGQTIGRNCQCGRRFAAVGQPYVYDVCAQKLNRFLGPF